jgi:hypothetical protein
LFADYELGYTIIELIGEWNDAIENDIMELRREVTDLMVEERDLQIYPDRRKCAELSQQRRQLL